jgi:hypothetical protein
MEHSGMTPSTAKKAGVNHELFSRENLQHIATNSRNMKIANLKKIIAISSITVAICIFAVLTFNAYKYTIKPVNFKEVPLIISDNKPIKVAPANPGGVHFDNQDKLVYEAIEKKSPNKPAKKEPTKEKNSPTPSKDKARNNIFDMID